MKRILLVGALASAISGGGWALAQTAVKPAAPAPAAAHDHAAGKPGGGEGMMCGHMMGGGSMPGGMCPMCSMGKTGMGSMGMMGGGMGPLMAPGTKVAVKAIDKGVTITLTTSDAAAVVRLQKMAEAMRLMHEAMNP